MGAGSGRADAAAQKGNIGSSGARAPAEGLTDVSPRLEGVHELHDVEVARHDAVALRVLAQHLRGARVLLGTDYALCGTQCDDYERRAPPPLRGAHPGRGTRRSRRGPASERAWTESSGESTSKTLNAAEPLWGKGPPVPRNVQETRFAAITRERGGAPLDRLLTCSTDRQAGGSLRRSPGTGPDGAASALGAATPRPHRPARPPSALASALAPMSCPVGACVVTGMLLRVQDFRKGRLDGVPPCTPL